MGKSSASVALFPPNFFSKRYHCPNAGRRSDVQGKNLMFKSSNMFKKKEIHLIKNKKCNMKWNGHHSFKQYI